MLEILEILLLSFTLFFEASGEPLDSKIGHAYVIKNRVDSRLFANNYYDVIFQPKHFSCYNSNEILKHIKRLDKKVLKKCLGVASKVYRGEVGDNTNGALWYARVGIRRIWMKNLVKTATYGNTSFYSKAKLLAYGKMW